MSHLSLTELIRQNVLDLSPEPLQPPCPIPPRLLILACSAYKTEGEGVAARDRYQGFLWHTLRAADPGSRPGFIRFLSAKFGLGDARTVLPHYDEVPTEANAARMIEGSTCAHCPELPQACRVTGAAKMRATIRHGPQRSPSGVLALLELKLGQACRNVPICGGHRYVRIAASWLSDFRTLRRLAANAPVTVINEQISVTRSHLRAWITR